MIASARSATCSLAKRLLAAGGVGYTLNALVIAALMLAVTPGSVLPVPALAWIEGWLRMPFDVIMIGLLMMLLPVRGWPGPPGWSPASPGS
jgi:hypothetical protein